MLFAQRRRAKGQLKEGQISTIFRHGFLIRRERARRKCFGRPTLSEFWGELAAALCATLCVATRMGTGKVGLVSVRVFWKYQRWEERMFSRFGSPGRSPRSSTPLLAASRPGRRTAGGLRRSARRRYHRPKHSQFGPSSADGVRPWRALFSATGTMSAPGRLSPLNMVVGARSVRRADSERRRTIRLCPAIHWLCPRLEKGVERQPGFFWLEKFLNFAIS